MFGYNWKHAKSNQDHLHTFTMKNQNESNPSHLFKLLKKASSEKLFVHKSFTFYFSKKRTVWAGGRRIGDRLWGGEVWEGWDAVWPMVVCKNNQSNANWRAANVYCWNCINIQTANDEASGIPSNGFVPLAHIVLLFY